MPEIPQRVPESNPSVLLEMTKKARVGYFDNVLSLQSEVTSFQPKDRQDFLKAVIIESVAGYKRRLEKFKIKYDQTPEEDRDFLDEPSAPTFDWLSEQRPLEGLNLSDLYQITKKALLEINSEGLKKTWSNIVLSKNAEKFNVSADDRLDACRCALRNGFGERLFKDPNYLENMTMQYRIQLGEDVVSIIDEGEHADVAVKAVDFLFTVPHDLAEQARQNPQIVDALHSQKIAVWQDSLAKIVIACLKDEFASLIMVRRYDDLNNKFPQLTTYSFDYLLNSIKNEDERRQLRELFAARLEEYKNPPAADESMSESFDDERLSEFVEDDTV